MSGSDSAYSIAVLAEVAAGFHNRITPVLACVAVYAQKVLNVLVRC